MDYPIGVVLFVVSLNLPLNFLPADGKCLAIKAYPELAEALHDGPTWPYGRCMYNQGFKLPNLCDRNNKCAIIKVK